jgi:putative membrane protein
MNRFAIAVLLLLLTACSREITQQAHPKPPGPPPRADVLSLQDRDFFERAVQGSNAEVAMGTLVRDHALRAEVIAFGQRMVADHGAINKQLAAIAASKRITPPTDLGEHQRSFDEVVDRHADGFDRRFVRIMIDDHHAAIELFKSEASGGIDPQLRAFAAATLPLLEAHLHHVQTMAQLAEPEIGRDVFPASPSTTTKENTP